MDSAISQENNYNFPGMNDDLQKTGSVNKKSMDREAISSPCKTISANKEDEEIFTCRLKGKTIVKIWRYKPEDLKKKLGSLVYCLLKTLKKSFRRDFIIGFDNFLQVDDHMDHIPLIRRHLFDLLNSKQVRFSMIENKILKSAFQISAKKCQKN